MSHEHGESASVATAVFARALLEAGYELRVEPDRESLTVDVTTRTGRVLHDELAFTLLVRIESGRRLVTEVQRSFVAEPRNVDVEHARPLLAALVNDGALARLVREREEARQKAEAAERRRLAEREARREEAWREAHVEDCRSESTDEACRPLKTWLERNANDARAGAARGLLEETEAQRSVHRERKTWAEADVTRCRAPTRSTDCDGVAAYLLEFARGPHAEEAREVLDRSRKLLDGLAAREERSRVERKRAGCRAFCTPATASAEIFQNTCRGRPLADQGRCRRDACESTCMADPDK